MRAIRGVSSFTKSNKFNIKRTIKLFAAASIIAVQPLYGIITSHIANAATNVHTTDLNTWYLGDTRATGHNELVSNGLRVWTEGATTTDKAAGYRAATPGLTLSDVNSTSINFASYTGGRPSVQLGVDRDGNGSWDGYLVYEPWAYGDGQYWTNKENFGVAAGGGYPSMGTLAQYQAANPNAKVLSIGYSLGSGVKGDAVISSIVIGNTTYTFGLPPVQAPEVAITAPREAGVVATTRNGNTLNVTGKFTDDKAVNYLQLELVKAGNLLTVYTMHYSDLGLSADGSFNIKIPVANLETGDYSLYYTGTDFDGGVTERFVRNFVIDNTAPETTLVTPTGLAGNTFTVSGVAKDNVNLSRAYVQLVNRQNSQRYGGTTIYLSGTEQNWSRTFNASELNLPEGQYAAHVAATDSVGNTTNVGWSANFTLDKTAPSAPTLSVTGLSTGSFTNNYNVTANWNTPSSDTVSYDYKYWNNVPTSAHNMEANAWINTGVTGNSYSGVFNQGEGAHYMQVRATDQAGNKSEWSNTFVVNYDATAPTVSVNDAPQEGSALTGGTATITGTVNDSNFNQYRYQLLDSSKNPITNSIVGGSNPVLNGVLGSINLDSMPSQTIDSALRGGKLPNGTYYIRVWATDKAGNQTGTKDTPFVASFTLNRPVVEQPDEEDETPDTETGTGNQGNQNNNNNQSSSTGNANSSNNTNSQGSTSGNASNSNTTSVAFTNNTPLTPFFTATPSTDGVVAATPSDASQEPGEVLGAEDTFAQNAANANQPSSETKKVFGVNWYWIPAGGLGLGALWWLLAAFRRKNGNQA